MSVSIKRRPLADGSVRWYLHFRPALPDGTTLIPVKGASKLSDRPIAEAQASLYRAALAKGLSEPAPENANGWFGRYTKRHAELGHGTAQHAGDWARYVAPMIGTRRMIDVTPDDVKAIRDSLTRLRLDSKLSAKRAINLWSTVIKAPLSRAFSDDDPKYADLRVGPAKDNPAAGIKPPVSRDDQAEDERERQALEPSEALALLSCEAVPVEARRLYAWLMFSGLRPGEIYGLDWADVRANVIKVQRARNMKLGSIGNTKTRSGVRDVPIHPHLAPLAEAMRQKTGRVFDVARARDVEARVGELRAHLLAAGVDRPELHDGTATLRPFDVRSFRTTFATWAKRSGCDSSDIDAWLGHAPKTTAAKHYTKDTGPLLAGVFPALPEALLEGCERPANCERPDQEKLEETTTCEDKGVRRKGLETGRNAGFSEVSGVSCEPAQPPEASEDEPPPRGARVEIASWRALASAASTLLHNGFHVEARGLVDRLSSELEAAHRAALPRTISLSDERARRGLR